MVSEFLKHDGYVDLFKGLEAEDIDSIRFCGEEIAFWLKVSRREKDKIKKFFYGEYVTDYKNKTEDLHHGIIERRQLKKEFERISG